MRGGAGPVRCPPAVAGQAAQGVKDGAPAVAWGLPCPRGSASSRSPCLPQLLHARVTACGRTAPSPRTHAAGEKLYIHCWGGRGRAGLVGGCLLREAYGISGEEALARVQKAFDTRL